VEFFAVPAAQPGTVKIEFGDSSATKAANTTPCAEPEPVEPVVGLTSMCVADGAGDYELYVSEGVGFVNLAVPADSNVFRVTGSVGTDVAYTVVLGGPATFLAGSDGVVSAGEVEFFAVPAAQPGTVKIEFGDSDATKAANTTPCAEPEPEPTPRPVPTPVATPGTVVVNADAQCVADVPAIIVDVDFTDNDVPVESVTVTLEDGTGILASYDYTDDASSVVLPWPDLDVTSIDVRADGVLVVTVTQDTDCADVAGVEIVDPTPTPTPTPEPEPTVETEVLGEEVVSPVVDVIDVELAATGTDAALGLALGSVLVAGGVVLLLADRRRRLLG
jgi:hypothetical protein